MQKIWYVASFLSLCLFDSLFLKAKLGSRKITVFPRMKVHAIKYLKIAMICSVIRFVENNRVIKIVILLP